MAEQRDPILISDDDRRAIGAWAADCAERVLPLFEAKAPADRRPREAIDGIRNFVRDGKRSARLRSLFSDAYAAAREVGDPAAAAAARAAGVAAATAFVHATWTPNQEKHALGAPVYAARARELATGADPGAADEEIRWAVGQASTAVRKVIRRMPARERGRGRMDELYYQLDAQLRHRARIKSK